MNIRIILVLILSSIFCSVGYAVESTEKFLISGFEIDSIPVVRPSYAEDSYQRYLWSHYPQDNAGNQRPGKAVLSSDEAFAGDKSLKTTVDSAMNIFAQYYPYDEGNYEWLYVREQEAINKPEQEWKADTYNRLRFWIKVPSSIQKADVKRYNAHFGTYIRGLTGARSSAESGGGHYYHYYNIGYSGEWHQVIVDMHPSHERGKNGNEEQGSKEYSTGDQGVNYFDLMTRFYFTFKNDLTSYPGSVYLDGFELYNEPNLENVDQVYALHGVYIRGTNVVSVGWNRPKGENDVKHEVRYSFSDMQELGWANATSAPGNSLITPPGQDGYNGMEYETSAIDVGANPYLYVGIKPENSALFRQIRLSVSESSGNLPLPAPGLTSKVLAK
tara:strand:- start:2152 stop:3309 length:1158 start_codon:yes stop_codon:yes gene_type:complete